MQGVDTAYDTVEEAVTAVDDELEEHLKQVQEEGPQHSRRVCVTQQGQPRPGDPRGACIPRLHAVDSSLSSLSGLECAVSITHPSHAIRQPLFACTSFCMKLVDVDDHGVEERKQLMLLFIAYVEGEDELIWCSEELQ